MAKDFYFKFYFKEWLVSTQGMAAEVRGWYFNLLCHQADKRCLPNDLESLAELAGVKMSEFEKFKLCYKRTLEHKFKQNEDGTLYNQKMAEVIEDRKDNSTKQSKRATVGVFVKKNRGEHNFSEAQWKEVSADLMKVDFRGIKKENIYSALSVRFNRMVEAVINNSNSNYNYNTNSKEKEGLGEKTIEENEIVEESAFDILNKTSPAWLEAFEMRVKSEIPDYATFKTNFEFAVAKDEIPMDNIKLLKLRLNKLHTNWDKTPKNKLNVKPQKHLSNQR